MDIRLEVEDSNELELEYPKVKPPENKTHALVPYSNRILKKIFASKRQTIDFFTNYCKLYLPPYKRFNYKFIRALLSGKKKSKKFKKIKQLFYNQCYKKYEIKPVAVKKFFHFDLEAIWHIIKRDPGIFYYLPFELSDIDRVTSKDFLANIINTYYDGWLEKENKKVLRNRMKLRQQNSENARKEKYVRDSYDKLRERQRENKKNGGQKEETPQDSIPDEKEEILLKQLSEQGSLEQAHNSFQINNAPSLISIDDTPESDSEQDFGEGLFQSSSSVKEIENQNPTNINEDSDFFETSSGEYNKQQYQTQNPNHVIDNNQQQQIQTDIQLQPQLAIQEQQQQVQIYFDKNCNQSYQQQQQQEQQQQQKQQQQRQTDSDSCPLSDINESFEQKLETIDSSSQSQLQQQVQPEMIQNPSYQKEYNKYLKLKVQNQITFNQSYSEKETQNKSVHQQKDNIGVQKSNSISQQEKQTNKKRIQEQVNDTDDLFNSLKQEMQEPGEIQKYSSFQSKKQTKEKQKKQMLTTHFADDDLEYPQIFKENNNQEQQKNNNISLNFSSDQNNDQKNIISVQKQYFKEMVDSVDTMSQKLVLFETRFQHTQKQIKEYTKNQKFNGEIHEVKIQQGMLDFIKEKLKKLTLIMKIVSASQNKI